MACAPGLTLCSGTCISTFYDDNHCGKCDIVCGSGNVCQAGRCVPTSTIQRATGLGTPNGIALDAQHVYWTDIGTNAIMRVAKAGGMPELVAGNQYKPLHVVVDDTYAYWTNSLGAAVMKAPKVGGGVPSLVTTADHPTEIAQDNQTIYFIEGGSMPTISAVPKAGGTASVLLPAYPVFTPRGLVLDANYVYAATYRGVSRVPKGGGTVEFFGTEVDLAGPLGVAVDDVYVYTAIAFAGTITPFAGTYRNLKSMASLPHDQVTPLVAAPILLDGDYIYENLTKVSRCGGAIITIRAERGNDIGLDSDYVYWTAPGFVGAAIK